MTAQPQKEAIVPVVHDPVFINTTWGAVSIYGHELVSKKDLVIIGHCLALPDFAVDAGDHGVRMIMFRDDNRPYRMQKVDKKSKKSEMVRVPLMASCVPDAQAIIINLEQTFITAVEESEREGENASLKACFHRNMIMNYLHEIHHMERLHKIGMAELDDATRNELEDDAQTWSLQQLFVLAKTVDIEPAHHAESSYLSAALMALLLEEKDEWSKRQRHMLENNIMYELLPEKDKHEGLTLMSFKGICHLMSGDDVDSPEWKKETISLAPLSSAELPQELGKPHDVQPGPQAQYVANSMDDAEYLEIPPGTEGIVRDPDWVMYGRDDYENSYEPPEHVSFTGPAVSPTMTPVAPAPLNTSFPVAGQPAPPQYHQTTPSVVVYPRTGLTPMQTRDVVFSVFNKLYSHIFTHCGRLLNSDVGFQNPEAVYTMPVNLTEQEKAVVVKCDCLDVNGRWCANTPTVNGIRGYINKNTKLPAYKIYINNDGYEAVRLLLPQNPAKRAGADYSKPALAARNGSCIMYIMEGLDKADFNDKGKFYFKCIDNVWQAC
jgi:hypothetical protein